MLEDGFINSSSSRRSFSGVIQRHYASKASSLSTSSSGSSSLSSSFSLSSAGSHELHLLNKSTSAELENSIEGAIAYCKKSQQQGGSNKACSRSTVCGNKDIIGSEKVEKSLVKKNEFLI
ncbi:membrane-associated kinase regulator 3 [Spatholobus suberectus]|nr:membrane-associated kinase regulator 3 [Spatholobus suberectus]